MNIGVPQNTNNFSLDNYFAQINYYLKGKLEYIIF